jgi:hypothetical protein
MGGRRLQWCFKHVVIKPLRGRPRAQEGAFGEGLVTGQVHTTRLQGRPFGSSGCHVDDLWGRTSGGAWFGKAKAWYRLSVSACRSSRETPRGAANSKQEPLPLTFLLFL